MKKYFLITIGFLILIIGGLSAWYFLFQGKNSQIGEAIRDVLPFGNGGGDTIITADEDKPIEIEPTNNAPISQKLFRLSETPVAGSISILKNGSEVVRFVDRATGHIYDINPRTLQKIKVANNTQPKIYEALFRKDGNGVIFRSLKNDSDEISNLSIELVPPKSTSTDALYTEVTSILRGDINSIAISTTSKIAYSEKDLQKIAVANFTGNNPQTLYSSPFTNWNVSWSGNSITLTTAASAAADGYSYSLSSTGSLTKLIGPINGLTVNRSPDGGRVIYSSSANGRIQSFTKNLRTGQEFEITPSLLPEKCAWSLRKPTLVFCGTSNNFSEGGEPDLWYQGRTHLDDTVWQFDTETGISGVVVNPQKTFGVSLDIINPFLTPDEDYLVFINKNDLSLWALKLVD